MMQERKLDIMQFENDVNGIHIEGLGVFDWGYEPEELRKAHEFCCKDLLFVDAIHGDVRNHFLECFAEFTGKKFTLEEINQAISKNSIEC